MTVPTANTAGLHPTGAVAIPKKSHSITRILNELWGARDLVVQFILRDITVRYTQAVMGFAWALFMPLLIVGAGLIFRVVMSNLSGTQSETSGIASLLVKALPWAFFSAALSTATQSILAYANLIGKVKFPREALPVASVVAQGVDLVVSGVVVVVALPFLGIPMGWASLWAVLLLVLLVVFTIGCALILSCANLFYRDIKYIVQVTLNFGVFATPVFFEPQMLPEKLRHIMLALPLTPFIQGIDLAMTRRHNLLELLELPTSHGLVTVWSPWMLFYATLVATTTLLVGLRIFRRGSAHFAEMA